MKKNKTVCLISSLAVVGIIIIVIFVVGYSGGMPEDEAKQQFPAVLNVELADTAGFSDQQIRDAPYFYYDTKLKEEKEFFQPAIYEGCDHGCVILYEEVDTTTRAEATPAQVRDQLFTRATTFIEGMNQKIQDIDYRSGGSVVTEWDEGESYTEDYTYSLRSELYEPPSIDHENYNETNPYALPAYANETIDGKLYPSLLELDLEWWVWSEGSGEGWRAFFTTIYATFEADYDHDIIITTIAHGANPVDAYEDDKTARESQVYQSLKSNGYLDPGAVNHTTDGKYDTFSGTRLSTKNDKPTQIGGTGSTNLLNWFQQDAELTQTQEGDPGTYGYFIAYGHTHRYTSDYAYGHGYRGDFANVK